MSALRSPKLTHHAANGNAHTANDKIGDRNGRIEGRRRVYTLSYKSSASTYRHNLPRHSLHNQDASVQLNWSVEEELKRRRRLAGFDQSYGELMKSDSDSDPESGEATEADEDEWKQVSDRKMSTMSVRPMHTFQYTFRI